jgi:hypothetical protein
MMVKSAILHPAGIKAILPQAISSAARWMAGLLQPIIAPGISGHSPGKGFALHGTMGSPTLTQRTYRFEAMIITFYN